MQSQRLSQYALALLIGIAIYLCGTSNVAFPVRAAQTGSSQQDASQQDASQQDASQQDASHQGELAQLSPHALGSISGTIYDEDGSPLSGVIVTVRLAQGAANRPSGFLDYQPEEYVALTDAQGAYAFNALPTGIYRVEASMAGTMLVDTFWSGDDLYTPRDLPLSGIDLTGIDITLPLGGRISGSLAVSAETRFDFYQVSIYQAGETDSWDTILIEAFDADASAYETSALLPGTYRICASVIPEGNGPASDNVLYSECFDDHVGGLDDATDILVQSGQQSAAINFELNRSRHYAQISGIVTGDDGEPAADILVQAYPAPDSQWSIDSTRTDAAGRYSLAQLPPGSYYIDFSGHRTPYLSEYYVDAQTRDEAQAVEAPAGEPVEEINAELVIGGRVTGNVMLQGERPPLNGKVYIFRVGTSAERHFADIDPITGQYTVEGLPSGSYHARASEWVDSLGWLTSYYGSHDYFQRQPFSVSVGITTTNIDIHIAEGQFEGQIQGNVSTDDAPLANIRVELLYSLDVDTRRNGEIPRFYTYTDEHGDYTVGGLGSEQYYLRFVDSSNAYLTQYNGGKSTLRGTSPIRVIDGEITAEIDAVMQPAGAIQGTIMHKDGFPARGYAVEIRDDQNGEQVTIAADATDGAGNYEIAQLAPGTYQFLVFGPSYDDGDLQTADNSLLYDGQVVVVAGEVAAVGQGNIIRLGSSNAPTNLPTAEESSIAPILFVPLMIN